MNLIKKVKGQASVEYLVVCVAIFFAFAVPLPLNENQIIGDNEHSNNAFELVAQPHTSNPTLVEYLINVLKRNYEAYSYSMSVAEIPD